MDAVYTFLQHSFPDKKILLIHKTDGIYVTDDMKKEFQKDATKFVTENNYDAVLLNSSILCGVDIKTKGNGQFDNVYIVA